LADAGIAATVGSFVALIYRIDLVLNT